MCPGLFSKKFKKNRYGRKRTRAPKRRKPPANVVRAARAIIAADRYWRRRARGPRYTRRRLN